MSRRGTPVPLVEAVRRLAATRYPHDLAVLDAALGPDWQPVRGGVLQRSVQQRALVLRQYGDRVPGLFDKCLRLLLEAEGAGELVIADGGPEIDFGYGARRQIGGAIFGSAGYQTAQKNGVSEALEALYSNDAPRVPISSAAQAVIAWLKKNSRRAVSERTITRHIKKRWPGQFETD